MEFELRQNDLVASLVAGGDQVSVPLVVLNIGFEALHDDVIHFMEFLNFVLGMLTGLDFFDFLTELELRFPFHKKAFYIDKNGFILDELQSLGRIIIYKHVEIPVLEEQSFMDIDIDGLAYDVSFLKVRADEQKVIMEPLDGEAPGPAARG